MRSILAFCASLCATAALTVPASAQLSGVVNESGKITLSVDGVGDNNTGSAQVQVNKPSASATVRGAYLSAASNFNVPINNGDISLAGTPVNWSLSVFNDAGPSFPNFYNNVFADVTSIVKPILDAAPAGISNLTVSEGGSTGAIDGSALAVIFDDPTQTQDNGVVLLFGGQATTGDQFIITVANPLDPTAPGAKADMGLGISFSFQGPSGSSMISTIDVNGQRLTSSAGGEDDGHATNGSLITVGGLGDSNTNPPPNAPPTSFSFDDELYNLLPFVQMGDTQIVVDTLNPSNDDNIFFGYFVVNEPISVDPETIFLTPTSATANVGSNHTVTATVKNASTNLPIVGRNVNFNVTSGPNAGQSFNSTTDVNGEAFFTFTSSVIGTDSVVGDMLNSSGAQQFSNTATVDWMGSQNYCTSKTNSCGSAPSIVIPAGTTSLGSSGTGTFDLTVGPVNAHNGRAYGLTIYSTSGQQTPVSTVFGWFCINQSMHYFRATPMLPTGTGCNASYSFDWGDYLATQTQDPALFSANLPAQVDVQAWYRDPTNAGGANTTDAGIFTVTP